MWGFFCTFVAEFITPRRRRRTRGDRPDMKFYDLDLSDDILDALDAMRFDECTPVQEQAIPVVLEGRDLIAVAQTGTGKTAAYLLPVIDRLYRLPEPEESVNCIVMAPTRELAQQIDHQMEGFSYYLPLTSVAIYGAPTAPHSPGSRKH